MGQILTIIKSYQIIAQMKSFAASFQKNADLSSIKVIRGQR